MTVILKKNNKKNGQLSEVWRRFRRNKAAILGLVIFTLILLTSIFADVLIDYETGVKQQDFLNCKAPPSAEHYFGTDEFGRDVFGRVIHGSRLSLSVGLGAVIISLVLGGTLGAIAGFYGGKLDDLIMRFVDILMAIPAIIMAITIMAALGSSTFNLMLAIGISFIPTFARIMRSSVMSLRGNEFVEAARSIGAKNYFIVTSEILPNCLAPILVQITMSFAFGVLNVSTLSFIGLGIAPPTPEWGNMLSTAREYLRDAPHMCLFPGLAIVLTILSLNLLGDGLRDALDPKLKQ